MKYFRLTIKHRLSKYNYNNGNLISKRYDDTVKLFKEGVEQVVT